MTNERVRSFNKDACIQGVLGAAKEALSRAEQNEILQDISERLEQKKNKGLSDTDATGEVFDELLKDNANRRSIETAHALRNAVLHDQIIKSVDDFAKKPEDIPKALDARIGGIASTRKGARAESTSLKQKVLSADLIGRMYLNLKNLGVLEDFKAGSHGPDLAQELFEAGTSKNDTAANMAKAVKPIYQEIVDRLRKNGIPIENEQAFITTFHRDPEKMMHTHDSLRERQVFRIKNKFNHEKESEAAFERWKNFELQLIDKDKTFRNGMLDEDEFMKRAYENQTVYDPIKRNADLEDLRAYGALGVKGGRRRVIHYKDGYSFYEANQEYGFGNLFNSIEETIDKGARLLATSEDWGTSPYKVFNTVIDELKSRPEVRGNQKLKNAINTRLLRFDELTGRASIPLNNTTNNITNFTTMWQSISKLGGSVTTAFNDLNYYTSSMMINFDENGLKAGFNALSNYLRHMRLGARKSDLENMGYWQKRITGQAASRFTTLDGPTGLMSKTMQRFMSVNAIHWHDNMLSGGLINEIGRKLYQLSGRDFDKLPGATSKFLDRYNITPEEWDLMRKNPHTAPDRRKYITPDDPILHYSKKDVASFLGKSVKDMTKSEFDNTRLGIRQKMIAMMRDESQFVYLEPDIIERSQLRLGAKPGTFGGAMMKLLVQFHTWPYAVSRRVVGRMLSDIGDTPGFIPKVNKAFPMLTAWIAGNMITGYISEAAINFAGGKEAPDPTKISTWAKASLGAAGVYGEALGSLVGQKIYGNSPLFNLGGPGLGEIDKAIKIVQSVGQLKFPSKMVFNFLKGNIPLINLFYIKLALNYLILWHLQEKWFPGSLWRQVRNAQREGEPPFLISPTSGLGV